MLHSSSPCAHTLHSLKLHQLLFGLLQLISQIIQKSCHLFEQSEGEGFSGLILTVCDSNKPLPQNASLRQAAAEQEE